ncbi:lipopolysaccharide biosynthesis protein [Methylobacterium sp. Leaf466]|uniref:lipopolysaccharide biosynthesis protein n=1 Tax=Methylobacterium sp. Leaf466 TaxID=1736386 RepID=UPI0006FC596F|nr:lipopolysaccharide biosynthesis protein [Methylobacterium sp. Leaf466]KQT78214.1 hypothetical protein ASG59_09550 [Methylobacterium sp. Leaf466]
MAIAPSSNGPRPRRLAVTLSCLFSTSTLIVSNAAQLVTFALLARGLGLEQFGLFMSVTAVTNVAVQICGLGAEETLVRRVAAEPGLYAQALGHHLLLLGGSGLVLSLILGIALPSFVTLSPDPSTNALALSALVVTNVVLVRVILLAERVYIARGLMGGANAINIGFALARTGVAALACGLLGVDQTSEWAFWMLGSHVLVAAACLLAIRRFGRPHWRIMRGEVRQGIYFTTPFLFRAFRQNIDFLMLSIVAGPEAIGAYSVARRIVDTSILTTEALHRVMYPRLARAAVGGYGAMTPLIAGLAALAVAIGLVTATATWLVAPAMPWLFGAQFGAMVENLRIMCWSVVFVAIHVAASEVLGASGRHGVRAAVYNVGNLLGAAVSAVLTYFLLLPGVFLGLYVTEISLAVAFWITLLVLVRRDGRRSATGGVAHAAQVRS